MLFHTRWFVLGFVSILFIGTLTAQAEVITYGDFEGNRYIYQNVKESSVTDPAGLFGAPTVYGDALIFRPNSFNAHASGAGEVDTTDGALGALMVAKPGNNIDSLYIVEYGDFSLNGSNGTIDTQVRVKGHLFISIMEIDNMPVDDVIELTAEMEFFAGPNSASYVPDPDGTWDITTHQGTSLWMGSLDYDIKANLELFGITGHATQVLLTFDNTLKAQSETSTDAFIAKKRYIMVTVPEPGTMTLILLGVASLGFFYRKRRS